MSSHQILFLLCWWRVNGTQKDENMKQGKDTKCLFNHLQANLIELVVSMYLRFSIGQQHLVHYVFHLYKIAKRFGLEIS